MDEIRVEVGVNESSKKKVTRSTRAGQMKNCQEEQMHRKWRGNGGEEDRNCDEACIESETVGEECKQ